MPLTFKNSSSNYISQTVRNIRYMSGKLFVGFNNTVEIKLIFVLDIVQLSLQADIFSRQMMTYAGIIDFKRFMGRNQDDWRRLFFETYVYDRVKNVFYGLISIYRINPPIGGFSFPGNILLNEMLNRNQFIFNTKDLNNFTTLVDVELERDVELFFKEAFETFPFLKEAMTINGNSYVFQSLDHEKVLTGLEGHLVRMKGQRQNKNKQQDSNLYEILPYEDDKIRSILDNEMNCPILNSSLNIEGNQLNFIQETLGKDFSDGMFNESLHFPKAAGFRLKEPVTEEGNNIYNTVPRDTVSDFLTREDLYSITGIKSDLVPYSGEQIINYLGIHTLPDGTVSKGINTDLERLRSKLGGSSFPPS